MSNSRYVSTSIMNVKYGTYGVECRISQDQFTTIFVEKIQYLLTKSCSQ